jgi:hypothetical protein
MLEEDLRVLRLCSVAGVWIHHELGVGQVLLQEKGVDRERRRLTSAGPPISDLPEIGARNQPHPATVLQFDASCSAPRSERAKMV